MAKFTIFGDNGESLSLHGINRVSPIGGIEKKSLDGIQKFNPQQNSGSSNQSGSQQSNGGDKKK